MTILEAPTAGLARSQVPSAAEVNGSDRPPRDLQQTKQSWQNLAMQHIVLDSYNLESAERRLCVEALTAAGNIVGAAKLLGLTRHALKRRIVKLGISWSRGAGRILDARPDATATAAHPA